MYCRAQSGGWIMCQDYDDGHSHSYTKQLHSSGRIVFAQIALVESRVWNRKGHLTAAFISRYIDNGHLQPYDENRCYFWGWNVTEITFNVVSLNAKARGGFVINYYEDNLPQMIKESTSNDISGNVIKTSNEFTSKISQQCLVYDNRTGKVIHTHQFVPISQNDLKSKQDLEKMAISHIPICRRDNIDILNTFHPEPTDIEVINLTHKDPMLTYKIDLETKSIITEQINFNIKTSQEKKYTKDDM